MEKSFLKWEITVAIFVVGKSAMHRSHLFSPQIKAWATMTSSKVQRIASPAISIATIRRWKRPWKGCGVFFSLGFVWRFVCLFLETDFFLFARLDIFDWSQLKAFSLKLLINLEPWWTQGHLLIQIFEMAIGQLSRIPFRPRVHITKVKRSYKELLQKGFLNQRGSVTTRTQKPGEFVVCTFFLSQFWSGLF